MVECRLPECKYDKDDSNIHIFFAPSSNYYGLVWSVQDSNFTITINPGATNNDSRNLIAPRNITVLEGFNYYLA